MRPFSTAQYEYFKEEALRERFRKEKEPKTEIKQEVKKLMTDPVGTKKTIICPDCEGAGCKECDNKGTLEATVVRNG